LRQIWYEADPKRIGLDCNVFGSMWSKT